MANTRIHHRINHRNDRKRPISRRTFLKIVAGSGAAGLALKYGIEALPQAPVASETRSLMGTIINIQVSGADPDVASTAVKDCFARMAELEAVLSRYRSESQLSILNRDGILRDAHPAVLTLIGRSQQLSLLTGGAFDITMKPLLDLYQAQDTPPDEGQITEVLSRVGCQALVVEDETIRFRKPDMSITLDGIAKGFIVDQGVDILQRSGFPNVLVEAGGDLMASGERTTSTPWKIGLQSPRAAIGELLTTIHVRDQALATSGDYVNSFSTDYANHHIIDPRTGRSAPFLASATVTAPDCLTADVFATALMVLTPDEGEGLLNRTAGVEGYLITKSMGEIVSSDFFRSG